MFNSLPLARRVLATTAVALTATVAAACTIDSSAQNKAAEQAASADGSQGGAEQSQAPKAKDLQFSVKDGAKDVDPSEFVTVKTSGKLKSVTMTNELGVEVAEKLSSDAKTWSTDEVLGYNHTYTIQAADVDGNEKTITFSTPQAAGVSEVALSPIPGVEVGVGQVIGVRFGNYVTDRKAAEKAITVKTTPEVEGAFYWINDQEVRWRPKDYWQPGTKVEVNVDLYGRNLGGGIYGGEDASTNFTIGDRVISLVDNATKTMKVFKNGQLLREIPVSLGTDGQWDTPNGRYIIGDEYESLVMDSSTFGLTVDAGGYRTSVNYATQMSYSGIYVHSAPWSIGAQGVYNQSHGCINLSPEAAQWFQSVVKRGDIVRVFNTGGAQLNPFDGLGDWNMDWETWSKGNTNANA
ncbi:Ig-like domain-containing protein [Corynebacterium simulans]|uniref:L,D-transpeptidase n=1 Tax=Corynebacterium simulans TaxID=146827 RepID=UPI000782CC2F|nr:Ig-like domain-containing protein [Corynebacterium simulans]AMO92238.1 L,D-transpeptidase catalytic domain protein [Corynebacterium simulans]MDK7139588.1 Ig-like domain-containing protein [Corynebacterium simulans]